MAELSYSSAPDPDERALIREAAALPAVSQAVRDRVLAAATNTRRRRVFVARIQLAVAALVMFTTITGLGGYYLSMWYGESLIARLSPVERTQTVSTGRMMRQNLVAAWRSTDDWDLVESRMQYKSYQTSILQQKQLPASRPLADDQTELD